MYARETFEEFRNKLFEYNNNEDSSRAIEYLQELELIVEHILEQEIGLELKSINLKQFTVQNILKDHNMHFEVKRIYLEIGKSQIYFKICELKLNDIIAKELLDVFERFENEIVPHNIKSIPFLNKIKNYLKIFTISTENKSEFVKIFNSISNHKFNFNQILKSLDNQQIAHALYNEYQNTNKN